MVFIFYSNAKCYLILKRISLLLIDRPDYDMFSSIEPCNSFQMQNILYQSLLKPLNDSCCLKDIVQITGKVINIFDGKCYLKYDCSNCEGFDTLVKNER